jgi:hypothetical protein
VFTAPACLGKLAEVLLHVAPPFTMPALVPSLSLLLPSVRIPTRNMHHADQGERAAGEADQKPHLHHAGSNVVATISAISAIKNMVASAIEFPPVGEKQDQPQCDRSGVGDDGQKNEDPEHQLIPSRVPDQL